MLHSPSGKWVMLDKHDIVLDASRDISPSVRFCKGRCVWDVFPTARDLVEPVYRTARQCGVCCETVFWHNVFIRLDCVSLPGDILLVGVQSVPSVRDERFPATAFFRCNLCDDVYEDVLPPLVDFHWPSCCDSPSFLLEPA